MVTAKERGFILNPPKTPDEKIEALRQEVDELSAMVEGLVAYVSSIVDADNVDMVTATARAKAAKTRHYPIGKVNVPETAYQTVLRLQCLASGQDTERHETPKRGRRTIEETTYDPLAQHSSYDPLAE